MYSIDVCLDFTATSQQSQMSSFLWHPEATLASPGAPVKAAGTTIIKSSTALQHDTTLTMSAFIIKPADAILSETPILSQLDSTHTSSATQVNFIDIILIKSPTSSPRNNKLTMSTSKVKPADANLMMLSQPRPMDQASRFPALQSRCQPLAIQYLGFTSSHCPLRSDISSTKKSFAV